MGGQLSGYRRKRDFERTPEPDDETSENNEHRTFVVQKHAASSLHYDFRLEIEGVLKSWAVPKGPSLHPSHKRLALETEDHPLVYADFEGRIPEDAYGGGDVIVWDRGAYTLKADEHADPMTAYENGEIKFVLHGQKLQGGFVLVKTQQQHNSWLLIKKRDDYADTETDILSHRPESVVTGETIADGTG